jgi:hypothetical protein
MQQLKILILYSTEGGEMQSQEYKPVATFKLHSKKLSQKEKTFSRLTIASPICDSRVSDSTEPPSEPPMEPRIAKIESRLDGMDARLNGIESTVLGIKTEVSQLRLWILGSVLAFIAAIITFGQYQASWFQSSLAQGREELRSSLAQTTEELRRSTDSRMEELRRTSDRQWEMAQKALDRASDAAIKAEAQRMFQEDKAKQK